MPEIKSHVLKLKRQKSAKELKLTLTTNSLVSPADLDPASGSENDLHYKTISDKNYADPIINKINLEALRPS